MEILNIEKLSFKYPSNNTFALKDISFKLNAGDFLLLAGESGCGKTTLLKLIKKEISPNGNLKGIIKIKSESLYNVGYILQNPDNQIVTEKVYSELAFGLENLGVNAEVMERKIGEMATYFGIEDLLFKPTDSLSGGQKQLINLASILIMNPKILLLDEPTAQLDPIATTNFLSTLKRINDDFGITIIIAEHNLEEIYSLVNKVAILKNGNLLCFGTPENTAEKLFSSKDKYFIDSLPSPLKLCGELNFKEYPLTINEGKKFLTTNFNKIIFKREIKHSSDKVILEFKDVYFRYTKNSDDILAECNLKINQGEIFSLLGGNGTGKTTLLNIALGFLNPYYGNVFFDGNNLKKYKNNTLYKNNIAYLPQNPETIWTEATLIDDFKKLLCTTDINKDEWDNIILNQMANFNLKEELLYRHPYDLSAGEQQKAALIKILFQNPKLLLLDEPSKALDANAKNELKLLLKNLSNKNITILMVTHDIEFAAEISDRSALFFNKKVVGVSNSNDFFNNNTFYTTAACRMSNNLFDGAITYKEVLSCCKNQIK